jgi:hypothetical protein
VPIVPGSQRAYITLAGAFADVTAPRREGTFE